MCLRNQPSRDKANRGCLTVKLSGARSFRRQAKALYPELRHVVSLSGPNRATAPTIVRGRLKPAYCARAEPPAQTSAIVLNAAADTTNAAEAEESPYRHAHLPRARLQLQAKGLRPNFSLSDFGFHNRPVASSNGEVERRGVFAAPSEGTLSRTSTRREPLRAYPRDRSNDGMDSSRFECGIICQLASHVVWGCQRHQTGRSRS